MMKQYNAIKARYPDALLLFRVGDFYETFGEDAVKAAQILGITLTKRANGAASHVELAGFPHHALDTYLPKLVRAGMRVAICDQLEDPKLTKTIVKRGVTELVTPGVSYNDKTIEHRSNNFLAAVHFGVKIGMAFLDVSTGEFFASECDPSQAAKLLQSFAPKEVLYQKQKHNDLVALFGEGFYSYRLDEWLFTEDYTREILFKHFQVKNMKGFGVDHFHEALIAAGVCLHYLSDTQHHQVQHITSLQRLEEEDYVWMDRFTIRNLELIDPIQPGGTTLLDILDHTQTPMGSRLLRRWIIFPLKKRKAVEERLGVVQHFLDEKDERRVFSGQLKQVGDLERLISKASTARINPREVMQLGRILDIVQPIKDALIATGHPPLVQLSEHIQPCESLKNTIFNTLSDDPPPQLHKGDVIKSGVSAELDEYRHLRRSGKDILLEIQQREAERTGIPKVKVAYNNVFGYYIEVTNTHKDKVPADWIRKQTLVNAERYISQELKELEQKILSAEEKIGALESSLYEELVQEVAKFIRPIQSTAAALARLDVLIGFAQLAETHRYCLPELNDDFQIDIKNGRHPVIEKQLPLGEEYVPNDIFLDRDEQQIIMITGPNMSGKSALLRQTALIALMAQVGSFVPAKAATLGMVDKIFTRVGASDNISQGESTFMVEMNETASILNNLSDRSLILLDEIGRGTSTYDGISIAWSIAEFLHEHPTRAKTLFATHYHELNEMTRTFPRIKNYNVSVKELDKKIIFLRKLAKGGSEHSFGIHVARMAGMPKTVVERAEVILEDLERSHDVAHKTDKKKGKKDDFQLSFFQLNDPVLEQIRQEILRTDINTLTPVEALIKLNEIKKITGG